MRLIFATSNPHKVVEARAILAPLAVEIQSLADIDCDLPEPVEDGATFEDNARLKACYYAMQLGLTCLAEDSGLEVDALHGAPGVYSARYAGVDGARERRDRANNEKLLQELAHVGSEQRQARFVCALAVADKAGVIHVEARGTYEGIIAAEPRGANGFGYDPVLYLPDLGRTSAELTPAEKHARSHRGQALRRLVEALSKMSS